MRKKETDLLQEEIDRERIINLFTRNLNVDYISQHTKRIPEVVDTVIQQYTIGKFAKRPFTKTCALCKTKFYTFLPNRQSCISCEAKWKKETDDRKNKKLKHAAYEVLGFQCYYYQMYNCCKGEKDERTLRIQGDRKGMQTNDVYKWIKNHPEQAQKEYRLICFNANFIINKYNIQTLVDYKKRPDIQKELFLLHEF